MRQTQTLRRTPATFLLIALAAWYGGRLVAAIGWQGEYLPRLNMVADLRVAECVPVEDFFAPRVACSPYYLVFLLAGMFAALMVGAAGAKIIQQRRTLAGAVPMGVALLVAGLFGVWAMTADPAQSPDAHYGFEVVALVALWCAMVVVGVVGVTSRRRRAMIDEEERATAAVGGPLIPVTWVLLGVSALGLALTVAAAFGNGYDNPVGLYQRMALDAPALWLLAVASGWWHR
ncbi:MULTISPECIES: hypothetical protein [unclassified Corynebacterium]|uniref:hypothetical protein n=1 Tax=unclassified Corynebacterium TaxID=2624378 RepID=UPI0029CA487D|nr:MULTISPECIES: hypothetical protein [unclassified Corynebacterium]WPF66515.1 hypothetical protein OLX12_01950 [Corynebacterium sp. 22KM0430]WPF69004.1 hypothetical protein OLW90_01945 [Corynebacterium sp. 21KM1197]